MGFAPSDRLGPYEIVAPIGAGGMGEVYKARDTRLDRAVAIKVLSPEKSGDTERKLRFLLEAKAASALNHANIVTIYDIGSENGIDYMAMEFIDGKTMDQLIPRNGMRLGELLGYAAQAADALAKAHQAGIVHRDLKPANLMVSRDGLLKVLDFGLAKLAPVGLADCDDTRTAKPLTGDGAVVGTAYYMSPEQAEGKTIDARSDIFSFGAVLFEMATGERPFTGDSPVAVLSSILREDPAPIRAARPDLPAELARVVTRCLRKDPARRFQHMADLRVALLELKEELDSGALAALPPAPRTAAGRTWLWRGGFAAGLVGVIAIGWRMLAPPQPMQSAAFRPVPLTSFAGLEEDPSFSPDGNQVVFSWNGEKEDNPDIYVKLIGPGSPLRLTTDPANDRFPRWSPDGRWIAFVREADFNAEEFTVFVVPALGGPERRIGRFQNHGDRWIVDLPSLCWTPDSKALIVSASATPTSPNRLLLAPLDGGPVRRLTEPDPKHTIYGDTRPVLSEDGSRLAFVRENDSVFALFMQSISPTMEPVGVPIEIPLQERLVSGIEWAPGGRELLFANGLTGSSTLFRIAARPGATPQVLNGLGSGAIAPSVSRSGARMAYTAETVDSDLWSVDLDTKTASANRPLSSSFSDVFPQFSPDGKRVAFYSYRTGAGQLWVANRDGAQLQQLTSLPGTVTASPRWSPDGQQIAFDSNTQGEFQVYVIASEGGRARLLTHEKSAWGANWSRDGRSIYFASARTGSYEVWKMPAEGGTPVQVTHSGGVWPTESADGKMLYFTRETGSHGLWRMPVDGGVETEVLPDVYRANYALTDKGVYFMPAVAASRNTSVRFLSFSTGAVTALYKVPKAVDDGLTISPDGRTLMYSQIDRLGRDLMLVENFK